MILCPLLLALLMVSCGKDYAVELEYIPVMLDRDSERWTLMNADGEVLKDDFKGRPSPVVNGVFYVYKSDKEEYELLKVKGDRAKEIDGMYKLYVVDGYYTEGVIAIKKKEDSKWEFVDDDGKTQFTLSGDYRIDGYFSDGMQRIRKFDEDTYESTWGFINTKGEIVIKAKYDDASPFVDGVAAVKRDDKWSIIDKKGEVKTVMKGVTNVRSQKIGDYFIVQKDDDWGLMNVKGEYTKVKYTVENFDGKYLIVSDEDDYGVVDLEGKRLIDLKYDYIQFIGKNFLCKKDDDKYVVLDADGDEQYSISDKQVYSINSPGQLFGGNFVIAEGEKRCDLLNPKNGETIKDSRFERFRF